MNPIQHWLAWTAHMSTSKALTLTMALFVPYVLGLAFLLLTLLMLLGCGCEA